MLKRGFVLLSAAALLFAGIAPADAAKTAGARRIPLRIVPVMTISVLQKHALFHAQQAQEEAEIRIAGARSRRMLVHNQIVAGKRPAVLGIRRGISAAYRGTAVQAVVVTVVTYGLYATDPDPATRQIEYTYNAQNGVLLSERARIADPATAQRYGLPVFQQRGRKK